MLQAWVIFQKRGPVRLNTNSHILIGRILCDHIKKEYDICLEKSSFLWGNIAPDLSILPSSRPHFAEYRLKQVREQIGKLENMDILTFRPGAKYCARLGMICHFYADFFCGAHNDARLKYSRAAHFRYEHGLQKYLADSPADLWIKPFSEKDTRRSKGISDRGFEVLLYDYLCGEPGFRKDIVFTLNACTEVIVSVVDSSLNHGMEGLLASYPGRKVGAG